MSNSVDPQKNAPPASASPAGPRRAFFGQALRQALVPVARIVEARITGIITRLEQVAGAEDKVLPSNFETGPRDQPHVFLRRDLPQTAANHHVNERFLRPPGAVLYNVPSAPPVPDGVKGALNHAIPRIAANVEAPGRLGSKSFEEACTRCNKCVEVCPAQAIKLDPTGLLADGLPYILARNTACVVCHSLACMNNCPDGALVPIAKSAVRMGRAEVNQSTCLHHPLDTTRETGFAKTAFGSLPARESFNCQACVDICPLGSAAILISPRTGRVRVQIAHESSPGEPEAGSGCIGCGLCEQVCPVGPEAAIIVRPAEAKREPMIA